MMHLHILPTNCRAYNVPQCGSRTIVHRIERGMTSYFTPNPFAFWGVGGGPLDQGIQTPKSDTQIRGVGLCHVQVGSFSKGRRTDISPPTKPLVREASDEAHGQEVMRRGLISPRTFRGGLLLDPTQ
jgi:hypothetical protein